jgi:hypothetical protein
MKSHLKRKSHFIFNPLVKQDNPLEDSMIQHEEMTSFFKILLSRLSNWEILVYFFQFRGYSLDETAERLSCVRETVSYTRARIKSKMLYLIKHGMDGDVRAKQYWW